MRLKLKKSWSSAFENPIDPHETNDAAHDYQREHKYSNIL
jgi:hypothetical protein